MNRSIQHQITGKPIATRKAPPQFSLEELASLQWYCLKFRDLVRGGDKPTPEQEARFVSFQAITHAHGVDDVQP